MTWPHNLARTKIFVAIPETNQQQNLRLRWTLYAILIAAAVGQWSGRIMAVNSVDLVRLEGYRIQQRLTAFRADQEAAGIEPTTIAERAARKEVELKQKLRLQRPFLSANDRSRWLAVRALVERGTFAIDGIIEEPGWDSIDKVRHEGRDGQMHYYSSKPPLLVVLLAGEYWLLNQLTGWTLADHPYELGRTMLLTVNVIPFALMLAMVAAVAERLCRTDWAKLFIVASAAFGTMLTAFAVTLNNHIVAAVAASVALYCWVRIRQGEGASDRWFVLAGLAAAFTFANELPALAFLAGIAVSLLIYDPKRTVLWFSPAAIVVVAAFFVTNYVAHDTFKPPYMHRNFDNPEESWYHYPGSHWNEARGMDSGEESLPTYALHTLVGHHGVFSMTPIWLLAITGGLAWLASPVGMKRELAIGVLGLTIVVLYFYIGMRPQQDRNYGGMSNGLRWMFWFAPLWLATMAPAADWVSKRLGRQAFALTLLAFSAMSAAYPIWNPWTQPWIYNWLAWWGFDLLG